jgi:hypothetical protein
MMSLSMKKMTCRALIVSMLALTLQTAGAGMIGADQASSGKAQADRALVTSTLARADVAAQLQAHGVDARLAADRVAVMNDHEVSQLAADIQAAPAGASTLLAVVVISAAIWYFFFRR